MSNRTAAGYRARPRIAITALFVMHALLFASWTAHIPEVKNALGLTDARLGTALLGAPVGSVLAMALAGWLLPRFGSRLVVQVTLVGYCAAGVGVGLAGSPAQLFVALALWGAFQGAMDVAMNTQGISVELAQARPLMSGLHGGWSLGALLGAGLGAVGVAAGLSLGSQFVILGTACAVLGLALTTSLLPDPVHQRPERGGAGARALLGNRAVLVLGGVTVACMLCEGAAADWSAVYLRDSLDTSPAVAGLGFTVFALAMVVVRLAGNGLLARYPAGALLSRLAAVATVVFAVALLVGQPLAALLGFAALAVGVASVVPTAFSAAGRLPGINPGTAVAAVSALGWAGYLAGPPLIGHLSAVISLPGALAVLPGLTLVISVVTYRTKVFDQPRES